MSKGSPLQYIKNYKFNSLFLKNFVLIASVIFLPLIGVVIGIYIYFQQTYLKEINTSAQSALHRVQETTDTVYSNIRMLGMNLSEEESVSQFLQYSGQYWTDYDKIHQNLKLSNLLMRNTNEYIQSIYIYSELNGYMITSEGVVKQELMVDDTWFTMYNEERNILGSSVWSRIRKRSNTQNVYPCISVAFYLPYNQYGKKQGVLIINMNNNWLDNLLKSSNENYQDFYIIDSKGTIVYNQDPAKLNQNYKEHIPYIKGEEIIENHNGIYRSLNNDLILNYRTSNYNNWKYVYITDLTSYQKKLNGLKSTVMLITVLLWIGSIIVSYLISVRVFLPVKSIIQMIEDPKKFYDMNVTSIEPDGIRNELKYITSSFMKSLSQNEHNQEELTNYVTKLKEAQVALLQSQINPHFLFNTLQTINFMAISYTKSDNEISQAIGMLSTMLRGMMEVDHNIVSIQQEIEYSKAYIGLEQLRYRDDLTVEWRIEEEILAYKTITITLQPILENCIRHGFHNLQWGGNVIVEGKLEGDIVVFFVTDNGIGQTKEWIDSMNQTLEEFQPIIGRHIGIRNVNQRIRMLFGNEYGVSINEVTTGFQVKVKIPKVIE